MANMRLRVGIAVILAMILIGGQALAREGRKIFGEVCEACHQAGGKGAAGVAPPLVSEPLKRLAASAPDYVPLVVLNGLSGAIEVAGTSYHLVMPPQAGLSDGEIAAVSTYVYATLNGQRTVRFTERQIAALRATPQKVSDLRALRKGTS